MAWVEVGEATKQSAAEPLEITDSSLPYEVYVSAGADDSAPITYWYSDQYWNSSTADPGRNCHVGGFANGTSYQTDEVS